MRPPEDASQPSVPGLAPGAAAGTDSRRAYWRLEALAEISGLLLEGRDPVGHVLPALSNHLREASGVDAVLAYRVGRYGDQLKLIFSDGLAGNPDRSHPQRLRFGDGVCGMAALTGEPAYLTHIQQSVSADLRSLREAGFQTYACEPVAVDGRLFGLIAFGSRSLKRFVAADLMLFQTLARHFALAADRAERIRELEECNRELRHRVNNALSTVQSIAVLSSRTETDPKSFARAFGERLVALGRTHNLLSHHGQNARLRDLLHAELKPFEEPGRVQLRGPAVRVPASLAIFLGIAAHELATNCANFGALSTDHGILRVCWWVPSDRCRKMLMIDWLESGGPPVAPPTRRGFGTRLLDGGYGRQIRVRREFAPAGLRVSMEVLLD